jgi:hypothetical protein
MNDALLLSADSSEESGNCEIKLGEAASLLLPLPLPLWLWLWLTGPEEVDGLPSAVCAAKGAGRSCGVHNPAPGSRDGASGEKLKERFSGGGTWERVNLARGSVVVIVG